MSLNNRQPREAYVSRMPSPPRITVPPPTNFIYGEDEKASAGTQGPLRYVDLQKLWTPMDPLHWRYESRREAQQILPFLFLGPMTAARDKDFIRKAGITLMIGIRFSHSMEGKLLSSAFKVAEELGLEHQHIDVANLHALVPAFPHACAAINLHCFGQSLGGWVEDAKKNPPNELPSNKVLVFCETGNEKSAAVLASYLMENMCLNAVRAIQIVQAHRFCANIDEPLRQLLTAYGDILKARQDVGQYGPPPKQDLKHLGSPTIGWVKVKRSYTDSNDYNDVDMTGENDKERFLNRSFAPFE